MTYQELKQLVEGKGYKFFTRNEELNVVAVRNPNTAIVNLFNDTLYVAYKDQNGKEQIKSYMVTTKPGLFYLLNPINKSGTGILVPGQYVDVYAISLHQGKYEALCQRLGNVRLYRDNDKDSQFDMEPKSIETTSISGVNIHKASTFSKIVSNWSAACTVFQESAKFEEMMTLARKHRALYGNKFTYTLIQG